MYTLEVVIKPSELQLLLNKFSSFEILYPIFSDHIIMKGKPNTNDGYLLDVNDVNLNHVFKCDRNIKSEIPDQSDLLECLLASSCIHYNNLIQFKNKCDHYGDLHKKIYFAADTNIFYHRFISRSLISDSKIVCPPTVRDEIQLKVNDKYSRQDIRRLKSNLDNNEHLFNELNNRRIKDSRKAAYFAKLEYKKINKILTDEVDIEINNYKDYDLKIVKELKNFEFQTRSSIILLTADRSIIDYCDLDNLGYFLFDYPSEIDNIHSSPSQLRELLFNLSCSFGFIKINNVIIFGEFSGKHAADELKLKFLNASLFEDFKKDLRICRRLGNLKIDF
ncbi:MAG: hypothetical protein GF329_16280 [Candidatus Lokiarchaeota archaeon]|nr:hypothetical protein [Candidatus Lokiarchaeota archaeon]